MSVRVLLVSRLERLIATKMRAFDKEHIIVTAGESNDVELPALHVPSNSG